MTTLCVVGKFAIIGTYSFGEGDENAVIVNSWRYIEIINKFFCLNYIESVCLFELYGFSKIGQRPTQSEHQWMFFAFSSVTALFSGLLTFLNFLVHLSFPCVIISCKKNSRHGCMRIKPVHYTTWRKLFAWKSKSTNQCWSGGHLLKTPSEMHWCKRILYNRRYFPRLIWTNINLTNINYEHIDINEICL